MKIIATARWGMLLLLPIILGCGGPALGKLSGKVTLNGSPVPNANITFRPADSNQNTVFATANIDGEYEALVPVGDVQVAVDNRHLAPLPPHQSGPPKDRLPPGVDKALKGAGSGPPSFTAANPNQSAAPTGKYIPLPDKYYDLETSGLGFRVEGGSQAHNIELTGTPIRK